MDQLLHFVGVLHQAERAKLLPARQPPCWCRCQNGAIFVYFEGVIVNAGNCIPEFSESWRLFYGLFMSLMGAKLHGTRL